MSFYINENGGLLKTDNPPAGYIPVQYPTQPETLRNNNTPRPREAILSDREIRQLCQGNAPLIAPFREKYDWHGISGGQDNNGYCIALGNQWQINVAPRIDSASLKDKNARFIINQTADEFFLLPNSCVLATSHELFDMPSGIMALSFGKSTLARVNLVTHVTPIEAGWRGYLTIEIANLNDRTEIILRAGMPITQIVFFRVSGSAYTGQYQNQPPVPVSALGNNNNHE
jgi:dCTP deaminase